MHKCTPIVWLAIACCLLAQRTDAQTHVWSAGFGDTQNDSGRGVAIDGSGNLIVTGGFRGSVDFGGGPIISAGSDDIFVAKYDPTGNHLWSRGFGDNQGGATGEEGWNVAVDGSNNMLVTGAFRNTVNFGGGPLTSIGQDDIFLVKLAPDGSHVWSRSFGGGGEDEGYGVAIDGSDNVIITGQFQGQANLGGANLDAGGPGLMGVYIAKYDANGNHLWSQGHSINIQYDPSSMDIAVDGSDNLAITGSYHGTVDFGGGPLPSFGLLDIFMAKFDSNGNHLWSQGFGTTAASSDDYGKGIAFDGSGNLYLTGMIWHTADFGGGPVSGIGGGDIFFAKFDGSGGHLWSMAFGHNVSDMAIDVAVDGSGNPIFTGYFTFQVNFGGGILSAAFAVFDVFLVQFDAAGNHLWSDSYQSSLGDAGFGVAVGSAGSIGLTGEFTGQTIDFGGGTITNHGTSSRDIFVARFQAEVTGVESSAASLLPLFLMQNAPNPFAGSTEIGFTTLAPGGVRLAIYDVSGRQVRLLIDRNLPGNLETQVRWDGRAGDGTPVGSGIYFYRLETGEQTKTRKLVLRR